MLARHGFSAPWITESVLGKHGVRAINPLPVFCENECCSGVVSNEAGYRDTSHLSNFGMHRLIERYPGDFDWVVRAD